MALSDNPATWMTTAPDWLKDRPLKDIVLPGSHDALMGRYSNPKYAEPFARTQGTILTQQLEAGCRYFDLRYKERLGQLFGWHGGGGFDTWSYYTPEIAWEEISRFLEKHPEELLILTVLSLREDGDPDDRALESAKAHFGDRLRISDNGASEAQTTLRELQDGGVVLIAKGFGDNDFIKRSGIYEDGDLIPAQVILRFLQRNDDMPTDRLWVWHINPPASLFNTSLQENSKVMYDALSPYLTDNEFVSDHRFSVINCDFVVERSWAPLIIDLNRP